MAVANIKKVVIHKIKHRLDTGMENIDWRHGIELKLTDDVTLFFDSDDVKGSSKEYEVDINVSEISVKIRATATITFIDEEGNNEYQETLVPRRCYNICHDTDTLDVFVKFMDTSKLFTIRGESQNH